MIGRMRLRGVGFLALTVITLLAGPASATVNHRTPDGAGFDVDLSGSEFTLTMKVVVPTVTCTATGTNVIKVNLFEYNFMFDHGNDWVDVSLSCSDTTPSYSAQVYVHGNPSPLLSVNAQDLLVIAFDDDRSGSMTETIAVFDVTAGTRTLTKGVLAQPLNLRMSVSNSPGGPLFSTVVFDSVRVNGTPFSALHPNRFDQTALPAGQPRLKCSSLRADGGHFKIRFI